MWCNRTATAALARGRPVLKQLYIHQLKSIAWHLLSLLQMVIACWCQREAGVNGAPPLSHREKDDLQFLYDEWAHPFFISYQEFCRMLEVRLGPFWWGVVCWQVYWVSGRLHTCECASAESWVGQADQTAEALGLIHWPALALP